jgi:hypothetical protein
VSVAAKPRDWSRQGARRFNAVAGIQGFPDAPRLRSASGFSGPGPGQIRGDIALQHLLRRPKIPFDRAVDIGEFCRRIRPA